MTFSLRKFLLCVPVALGCVLIAGCNQSDLKSRVASVEARLDSAPERVKETPRLPANAAPIRYTIFPEATLDNAVFTRMLLESIAIAPSAFLAQPQESGDIVVQGHGDFGSPGARWFEQHGFKFSSRKIWERKLPPKDLPKLEVAVFEKMNELGDAVSSDAKFIEHNIPGEVLFEKNVPKTGTRVATGNLLDIDLIDPELFIAAESISEDTHKGLGLTAPLTYLRSGRIRVDVDGRVRINDRLVPGVEKIVPDGSTLMSISPDGLVSAFDATGRATELGQLPIKRIKTFKLVEGRPQPDETVTGAQSTDGKGPVKTGQLEFPASDDRSAALAQNLKFRNALAALHTTLESASAKSGASTEPDILPLIVHKPLEKTAAHLKALGIAVEKTNERTTIGTNEDEADVTNALVAVMQGLRRRIAVNEENLRNADKTRDADGRLNPYRAKTITIGPKGVIVEGVDKSEFHKTHKPGDPDAGPDGYVLLSNVNKVVESAELKASIEEYKLIRTALERLAPKHIFPDPQ